MFANKYNHQDYSAKNTRRGLSGRDYHGACGVSQGPG